MYVPTDDGQESKKKSGSKLHDYDRRGAIQQESGLCERFSRVARFIREIRANEKDRDREPVHRPTVRVPVATLSSKGLS